MTDKKPSIVKRILRPIMRVGIGLALIVLFWSCASVPGLKEESVTTLIKVPFVRVLLDDNDDGVSVTADASFAIECLENDQQTVYYSSQPVRVVNTDMNMRVINAKGDIIQEHLTEVNLIPRGSGNRMRVNNRRYRGIMKVLPNGRNVRLVNVIYMEDYLKGVVPPEIGPRTNEEIEALKAQAVAARTYAMSHLQQYTGEPFDVKSSIIDQVYEGVAAEVRNVNEAIELTAGVVATYHDEMIDAYYHSTCGGMTDDIVDVWGKAEVPYLKPVHDTSCSWSKYFAWRENFTGDQLRSRIEQYLSRDRGREVRLDPITDIVIRERSAGGRITSLLVYTTSDVYRFSKDRIRWVVRRTSNPDQILPSANFKIDMKRDSNGHISNVSFIGAGYGHGVGMCQCGAIGRARAGEKFEDILEHFYSGIEIKKLY